MRYQKVLTAFMQIFTIPDNKEESIHMINEQKLEAAKRYLSEQNLTPKVPIGRCFIPGTRAPISRDMATIQRALLYGRVHRS